MVIHTLYLQEAFDLDDKEPIAKALDAIFEVMNVSRSHLVPNTPLQEAFDKDLKR